MRRLGRARREPRQVIARLPGRFELRRAWVGSERDPDEPPPPQAAASSAETARAPTSAAARHGLAFPRQEPLLLSIRTSLLT
jgi:hypothetical protein